MRCKQEETWVFAQKWTVENTEKPKIRLKKQFSIKKTLLCVAGPTFQGKYNFLARFFLYNK
jgi:hypothetical protein